MQNEILDSPDESEWDEEEPYYDWDDPDWREDWDDEAGGQVSVELKWRKDTHEKDDDVGCRRGGRWWLCGAACWE